jgi:hypothetical protein
LRGLSLPLQTRLSQDLTALLIFLAWHYSHDGASLSLTPPLNDAMSPRSVQLALSLARNAPSPTSTPWQTLYQYPALTQWFRTLLAHPAFPLQGRAWLRQPPVGTGHSPYQTPLITLIVNLHDLSAHEIAQALHHVHHTYLDMAPPPAP